jgi:hypothetical protein
MKALLLVAGLFMMTSSLSMAQSRGASGALISQAETLSLFNDRMKEFESSVTAKNMDAANAAFTRLSVIMQTHISEANRTLATAPDAEKAALKSRISAEQSLYTEIKMLSTDMVGNLGAMKSKLTAFQAKL